MSLERVLRISGRILAAVFVPVAVVFTLLLVAGSTWVSGALSIPRTALTILQAENFYQKVAPAVFTAALDSLPDDITVNDTTINIVQLVDALRRADAAELAQQVVSREWVREQIAGAVVNALSTAGSQAEASPRDRIALLRLQLTGSRAADLATLVLQTARECTQVELNRLRLLRGVQRDGLGALQIIDFVCAPPANTDLSDVVIDVLVVRLAHVADNLTSNLADYAVGIDLNDLGVDTPVGRVSLKWPGIHLASGSITLVYSLPADVLEPVDEAVQQVRSELQAVSDRVTSEVEQSQQNLESLRRLITREQTPLPTPTPAAVPTTPPFTNSTVTASATPTAEAPAPADDSHQAGTARISQIMEPLATMTGNLAQHGESLGRWIALISGLLLLLTTIIVLHLLRTISAMVLWTGAVLLLSGLIMLPQPATTGQDTAVAASTLPPSIAALRADFAQSVTQAVQQQISDALQLQGIFLAVVGLGLLLAALFSIWRDRRSPALADPIPSA